jgi:riboflavin synthase
VRIACSQRIAALIVEKGSIAIDGISLTVSGLFEDGFEVSIIPHTGSETTLLDKRVGDVVNLENDVVGKYVQRLLGTALGHGQAYEPESAGADVGDSLTQPAGYASQGSAAPPGGITLEFLAASGF